LIVTVFAGGEGAAVSAAAAKKPPLAARPSAAIRMMIGFTPADLYALAERLEPLATLLLGPLSLLPHEVDGCTDAARAGERPERSVERMTRHMSRFVTVP
jgi:hypothetical protein